MTNLLPLNISRILAPCESLYGKGVAAFVDSPIPQWLDDGATASVISVGTRSSFMFGNYLQTRFGQPLQIYKSSGQPAATVLDLQQWTTSVGPEPWIGLLLDLPLAQSTLNQTEDFCVLAADRDEFQKLHSMIRDASSLRGNLTVESLRSMLKSKGLVLDKHTERRNS